MPGKNNLTFLYEIIYVQKPLEVEVVEPWDFTHFLSPYIILILKKWDSKSLLFLLSMPFYYR